MPEVETLLVTGAAGFIGSRLVEKLVDGEEMGVERIVATDIRELPGELDEADEVVFRRVDIRDEDAVRELFGQFEPDAVVHLAAMVTPPPGAGRQLQYDVDVRGTRHVIEGCLGAGTRQFVYTSSGAAYGYHPDNPVPMGEDAELRGNRDFAYAHHKRIVEEELQRVRRDHPELQQLIFRVSTVLGPTTDNQITSLFEQAVITGIRGVDSPFCIIADDDVVGALLYGLKSGKSGIYNLTGDGMLTLREIADRMGARYVGLPEMAVRAALSGLDRLDIGPYDPEQVVFLKHRPVLDNTALVEDFGYRPSYTSREAFERYRRAKKGAEHGRCVLITGAGGGLGSALATEHAERGDELVLFDRDSVGLERTYMMLRSRGRQAVCIEGDVSSDSDCRKAVDAAIDAFGGVDILYNNAAIPHRGFFDETDVEEIERVLEVNLMGSIRMTEAALETIRGRSGRIVAISSVAGFAPLAGRTAYAASKHGMHGFFETLRSEVDADGVTVSMVCPAYLGTDFRGDADDGVEEHDVEDVARVIVEGVEERRSMILTDSTSRLAWWVRRLAPSVFETMMRRNVRSEFPT